MAKTNLQKKEKTQNINTTIIDSVVTPNMNETSSQMMMGHINDDVITSNENNNACIR